jgi:L-fucose mutarotase
VIADVNFPSASLAQRLIRADGLAIPVLLDAILRLFPLDHYVEKPIALMAVVASDNYQPVIWKEYSSLVHTYDANFMDFEYIERFAFYERARKAYAVLASSEMALYANIILKKGVIQA